MSTLVFPAKLLGHIGVFVNIAGPMWALSIRPHPAILLMVVGLLSSGASLMIFQRVTPASRGGRHLRVAGLAVSGGCPVAVRPSARHLRLAGRHARH